jgi:hypothetical protein
MMEQDRSFKGKDVVRFLKHALAQIPGKLLIIWDGSQIHRSQEVKDLAHVLSSCRFCRLTR